MIIGSIQLRQSGMTIRQAELMMQRIYQNGIKHEHRTTRSPFNGVIIQRVYFDIDTAIQHYEDRLKGDSGLVNRYKRFWLRSLEELKSVKERLG